MSNDTPAYRSVAQVGKAEERPGSPTFRAANVSSASVGRPLDPVIGFDHFHMRAPTFAPHPHAGFSAVTYLFEDGEGPFVNRDSLGHRIVVQPGAVIWTQTGSGVVHEEYPAVRGQLAHGLQIFVNLPAAEKLQPPRLLFTDGPDVVVRELPGVRVRVVTGASGGVGARLQAPHGVVLLDVTLDPGTSHEEDLPADLRALAYVIRGAARVGTEGRALGALDAASFDDGPGAIRLEAGPEGAQVVLLAGRPLREPAVSHGPFVMSDARQITDAVRRYHAGEMGTLVSDAFTA